MLNPRGKLPSSIEGYWSQSLARRTGASGDSNASASSATIRNGLYL